MGPQILIAEDETQLRELLAQALEVSPELKVLMMTAYAEDHPPIAALKAREIRTLQKPFDAGRLCDLVHEMLSRP